MERRHSDVDHGLMGADPGRPEATPEKVDNTNAIIREVLGDIARAQGVDVAAVIDRMAADGKLTADDVDAAERRGWIEDGTDAKRSIRDAVTPANAALRDAIEAIEAADEE